MAWTFSKRCKNALQSEKLKVSIKIPIRIRIWEALKDYDESYWEQTDWGNRETSTIGILPEKIKAELGLDELLVFPKVNGSYQSGNLEEYIIRGNYPPYLFDLIEMFYQNLNCNKDKFQTRINEIMEESNLSWRMVNGNIFPIDSSYMEEQIIQKAYELTSEVSFHGASLEFEQARVDLASGDYQGAINNSNQAIESVIKEILGIQKAKPGELFNKLIKSGIIPEYHQGFLKAFEEHILRSVANPRNQEPGVTHGRGNLTSEIQPELAEMCVGFSGVLIIYLIKMHLNNVPDDIPF